MKKLIMKKKINRILTKIKIKNNKRKSIIWDLKILKQKMKKAKIKIIINNFKK